MRGELWGMPADQSRGGGDKLLDRVRNPLGERSDSQEQAVDGGDGLVPGGGRIIGAGCMSKITG